MMEEVPPELIINWDHTGISIVPGSAWTMEVKGSKRVEIVGISDHCAQWLESCCPFKSFTKAKQMPACHSTGSQMVGILDEHLTIGPMRSKQRSTSRKSSC